MPPRSKAARLPVGIKQWLDKALAENNFSDYELLASELKQRGFEISKSALQRYGADFERRLAAIKTATEQARAVVAAAPDEEGAVNESLVRLVQQHLFNLLAAEDGKIDLPKVARAVAELGKASVSQKRWQAEARKKALEDAANAIGDEAKAQGMDAAQVDFWRGKVLGLSNG